jgi:hypothetical protein
MESTTCSTSIFSVSNNCSFGAFDLNITARAQYTSAYARLRFVLGVSVRKIQELERIWVDLRVSVQAVCSHAHGGSGGMVHCL